MVEESPRAIEEYVAGASLAFGIILLTQEAVGAYYSLANVRPEEHSGLGLVGLFVVVHLVGGFIGGYLVRRRSEESPIRAGAITSLLTFIIEYLYNLIFTGSFGGNLLALASLVTGSIGGAMLASRSIRS